MTTRQSRQPFLPQGEFVAGKAFRFGGKTFNVGDSFPWRKMSCSARRLRQLYESRLIEVSGYMADEPLEEEDLVEDQDEGQGTEEGDDLDETQGEETEGQEDSDDEEGNSDEPSSFTFDPDIHEIDNPERGVWVILHEGEVVKTIDRDLAKKLKKATEPVEIDDDAE